MKKSSFGLKLKTLGISIVLFVISYIILQLLLMIPTIHTLYETLELFVYYQIFISTANPNEHVILIDEAEQRLNRVTYAELISGLGRRKAKVIAMDVLFDVNMNSVQDAALVAATQTYSNKIIHAIEFLNYDEHPRIPDRFQVEISDSLSSDHFLEGVHGASLPFKELLEVIEHLGCANTSWDIVHRDEQYFPVIVRYSEGLYPSLPLLTVMKFLDCPVDTIQLLDEEIIELKTNSKILRIPIDFRSQTLINFISPERFYGKKITIKEALERIEANSTEFKDKIIMIGNSLDSQEQTHGPRFQSYPNLIVYGSLISQILNNENIREGILESLFLSFILVVLGIIWLVFLSRKIPRFKTWYIYIVVFLIFLFMAIIALISGLRIYVVLPYVLFSGTYVVSNKFYIRQLRRAMHKPKIREAAPKRVFISYSHQDMKFAKKLKGALEAHGVKINIDIETLKFGDEIQSFIDQSMRETDFTISIVSKNSLKSAWVIVESLESLIYEKVEQSKKFVPVFIDMSFLEDAFQSELIEGVENSITTLNKEISKLSKKFLPTTNLENKRAKLIELRHNIDKVLLKLNQSLVADFSSERKFKQNLPKLIEQINSAER